MASPATQWRNKRIAGVTYDLSHLHPLIVPVTPKAPDAPTFRVRFTFGSHTFTREFDEAATPDFHFLDGSDKRCFCTERYGLSKLLPGMIERHTQGRAYFSQGGYFLFREDVEGQEAPYAAFFNIEKAKKADGFDATAFVVSAYPKLALPKRLDAISFATLVGNTISGKPIRRPRK